MNWNHRVVRFTAPDEIFNPYLMICEVFYEDGEIMGHTEKGTSVGGYTVDELRQTLQLMLECLDKPIIEDMK